MNSLKAVAFSVAGLLLLWAGVQALYWFTPDIEPDTAPEQVIEAEPMDTTEDQAEATPDKPAPAIYTQWIPDLNQSIEQLEEWLATDLPQQELNFSIANLNSVYDAKLYIKFQELLKLIDDEDQADLIESQANWLLLRKTLSTQAFNDYGGGSLAAYHAGEIFLQLTRQRLDELNRIRTLLPTR